MKIKNLSLLALGVLTLGSMGTMVTANADNITENLQLEVIAENSLEMSLSTNQISFENYSGVEDFEDNLTVTVSSGLNYDLSVTAVEELAGTNNSSNHIDLSLLSIGENGRDSVEFEEVNRPVLVSENAPNGTNEHDVVLRIKGDSSVKADTYTTTLQFEAQQK